MFPRISPGSRRSIPRQTCGFALFLLLFVLVGCQPATERDDARLAKDTAATAELNRINTLLATTRPMTRVDLDSLVRLREQYPGVPAIRQLLQGALIRRGDWAGAEKVISEIPEAERTTADRINLAKVYLRRGRFSDAAAHLQSFQADGAERAEAAALLGQARFFTGDLKGAVETFESIRDELVTQQRADDLALLGTSYLRLGDNEKALDVLRRAVQIAPENVAANNALVQAYAAVGQNEESAAVRLKLEDINARAAAVEKRRSRQVALFYELEDAYAAKDFAKVIALVEQLRPDADDATKATLYQYLAAAYNSQGKTAEANNALADAAKLGQKQ